MDKTRFVQITRENRIPEEEFYPVINAMYEQIWRNLLPMQILTQGLSNTLAGNVITPADAAVPDCLTCGACCASLLCVGVRPGEECSPDDYWDIVARADDGEEIVVDRYLRRDGETLACTALAGTVGEQVGCRIYNSRPSMCRHFEAGSDRCHAIRRAFGLEPFLTLEEMSEALEKLENRSGASGASGRIQRAQIARQPETGDLEIRAYLTDGSSAVIHTYDPNRETWRQFEFDGLTMTEAAELIARRKSVT